mgnify:CR=1 FL=1
MTEGADAEYSEPDESLSRRVRGSKGLTQAQAVARGQGTVDELAGDYRGKLDADVAALAEAIAGDGDAPEAVQPTAMEIKTLAGTFGYARTGRAAASLCRYLTYVPADDPKRAEVLQSHLEALRYLVLHDDAPEDAEADRMLDGLEQAVAHRRARLE